MVKEVTDSVSCTKRAINSFKIALVNFDQSLFYHTFEELAKNRTFSQILHEILMPLLEEIEFLRQSNSVHPLHKHFLIGLLKEKLYLNITIQNKEQDFSDDELYVLFLPEYEIHDLGLLYLNYELKLRKRRTLFISPGLSLKDLQNLSKVHANPILVSYLTVAPKGIGEFLREFQNEICPSSFKELLLFGAQVEFLDGTNLPSHINIFKTISQFAGGLDLKKN